MSSVEIRWRRMLFAHRVRATHCQHARIDVKYQGGGQLFLHGSHALLAGATPVTVKNEFVRWMLMLRTPHMNLFWSGEGAEAL